MIKFIRDVIGKIMQPRNQKSLFGLVRAANNDNNAPLILSSLSNSIERKRQRHITKCFAIASTQLYGFQDII